MDWLRTTVTLTAGVPRVDITNRLSKVGTPAKESVFFAFPFAAGAPGRRGSSPAASAGRGVPTVPGAARHITPIRHWVAFDDGELTAAWATLEAPLSMFGDLFLPYAPFPPTVRPDPPEPGTVYSWALNNIWDTNFPAQQQGETTFRYAITSRAGADRATLGADAAAGLTDPLLAVPVTGAGGPPAPATARWCAVDHPLVRVAAIGASRRGHDLVRRTSRRPRPRRRPCELRVPGATGATVGTGIERDGRPLDVRDGTVRVPVPAGGFVAVSLDGALVTR